MKRLLVTMKSNRQGIVLKTTEGCTIPAAIFETGCDRCGSEKEIYVPVLKILELFTAPEDALIEARKFDAKVMTIGVIDDVKTEAVKSSKEFVDGTHVTVYQCKCGNSLNLEAIIKKDIGLRNIAKRESAPETVGVSNK